ncbi:DUF5110 domain-containing protein [Streptomyces sp. GTA36]
MPADVVADGGQTGGRRFACRVTDFGLESAPGGDGVTRASGRYNLYEDDGTTTNASQSATTGIKYTETGSGHTLRISPGDRLLPPPGDPPRVDHQVPQRPGTQRHFGQR